MNVARYSAAIVLCAQLTGCGTTNNAAAPPHLQAIAGAHHHAFAALDTTYHVYVRLPQSYAETDGTYPVVYLLDGGITFPLLAAYYRYLELGNEVPELIVVGIAYGTDDWRAGNQRSRDYTAPAAEREHYGGAQRFRAFLAARVIPLIEAQYRGDPARRVLFGQSLGGQFVLDTLTRDPDLFFGYIASNPALHRNLDAFMDTRDGARRTRGTSRAFVASGDDDEPRFREPARRWMTAWGALQRDDLALRTATVPGHSHFSLAPVAFRQGLQWVFADRAVFGSRE